MRQSMILFLLGTLCHTGPLMAHCQLPCGIYHDEMVYDQIDQFVETTVKALSVLEDDHFETVQDRNTFVRWVMQKDKGADEIASLLTTYFLQQKIKPGEADTEKRLISAHRLLFYLVQIKQTVDLKVVNDFYDEWERFKLMFHIENYKCKISQLRLKKRLNQKQNSGPIEEKLDEEEKQPSLINSNGTNGYR